MKTLKYLLPFLLVTLVTLNSCGYRNPNVYTGAEKSIYISNWKNRTNVLSLDMDIYQELTRWFQKSEGLNITKNRDEADIILAGEIVSIDLPSLAYGKKQAATEVKLQLKIRYIMKDVKTGKTLIEVPIETWTEQYLTGSSFSETKDNEKKSLDEIVKNLCQKIYRVAVGELSKI